MLLHLSPFGKVNRKDYFLGLFTAFVIFIMLLLVPIINLAAMAFAYYMTFCLLAKRLSDIGVPSLLAFILYGGFIFWLVLAVFQAFASYSGGAFPQKPFEPLEYAFWALCAFNLLVGFVPGDQKLGTETA